MSYLKNVGLIFVFSIIFSVSALGKTLYVVPDGTGTGIGWDDAIGDIQAAVNLADDGDIVLVSNGTYYLTAHITVDKPITVKGFYVSEEERPVVDGDNSVRGFYITDAAAQVTGFTISNCAPTDMSGNGGGVRMSAGLLSDCVVVSNTGAHAGGIYMTGGMVSNTTIRGNKSSGSLGGGGIHVNGSPVRIYGGQISDNHTSSTGGGICVNEGAMLYLDKVDIHSNKAVHGGGIYVYGKANISNCDISFNTVSGGSGGGITINNSSGDAGGTLTHSRVAENVISFPGTETPRVFTGGGVNIGKVTKGVLIANNEISGNKIDPVDGECTARGGGIYVSSDTVIRNCFIAHNWIKASGARSSEGGGIFIDYNAVAPNIVESCTIVSNYTFQSGGGVFLRLTGNDLLRNCILSSNLAGATSNKINNIHIGNTARRPCITYTCASEADGTWGEGCINDDPLFVDSDSGHYRLQSSSPCVNTGEKQNWMFESTDMDGRTRLDRFSQLVDMGCYEYVPQGIIFRIR